MGVVLPWVAIDSRVESRVLYYLWYGTVLNYINCSNSVLNVRAFSKDQFKQAHLQKKKKKKNSFSGLQVRLFISKNESDKHLCINKTSWLISLASRLCNYKHYLSTGVVPPIFSTFHSLWSINIHTQKFLVPLFING